MGISREEIFCGDRPELRTIQMHQGLFENKLGITNISTVNSIETERRLGNGQIDILIQYADGLVVGIENKKWAGLQPQQLRRYAQALQKESQGNFKLAF
jgi:RecB family endonuclease NucS